MGMGMGWDGVGWDGIFGLSPGEILPWFFSRIAISLSAKSFHDFFLASEQLHKS